MSVTYDILQDFPIRASAVRVYDAIATPAGLDAWWTLECRGTPTVGALYELGFGPEYQWRAVVRIAEPARAFALELVTADDDWTGTVVSFTLTERDGVTQVAFAHTGWRAANAHYRTTTHCWALYLRLLRRFVEHGERVAYDVRLDA